MLIKNPYDLDRVQCKPNVRKALKGGGFVKYRNDELPDKAGVYFLFDKEGKLMYVGNSINIRRRIAMHISENPDKSSKIPYDHVEKMAYLLINQAHIRNYLEVHYIFTLDPMYNHTKFQAKKYETRQ